ncbi:MAG: glycoside hydrolase family 2 TIM barrel-domain containing protein [Bacteroidaceae bacterium]
MKKKYSVLLLAIACCFGGNSTLKAAAANDQNAEKTSREKQILNRQWKFIMEDAKGAEAPDYNDAKCENVNLPHSFSMPYFMWKSAYNGYGWYRKTLDVPASWKGKTVSIEFEGAFIETEIYVNGTYLGKHVGGYTGFCFDMTPHLKTGNNVIAVRVNNLWKANVAPRAGDHQFSGGIYRDVYVNVSDKLHVDWYGTYFTTPAATSSSAVVKALTTIKNDYGIAKSFVLKTQIYSPEGTLVATVESAKPLQIEANQTKDVAQDLPPIENPKLWSPATPNLYQAVTTILVKEVAVDSYTTTFGIRSAKWTASNGFELNGSKLYLLGANVHQDRAGWGDATTNSGFFRDVKLMKDAGFNAIRGCHYPHDPAFVEACDKQGVIFFSENAFWGMGGSTGDAGNWGTPSSGAYPTKASDQKDFDLSVLQQLKEMIRIHRNSPSIMAWSMSNEAFFTDDVTMNKVRALLNKATDSVTRWDPSRLVAIGGCQRGGLDKLGKNQIAFYNGDGAGFKNPGVPNMVSEYSSRSAQRPGEFSPAWGELGADNGIDNPAPTWRGGQAIWCGIDHGTVGGAGLATMGLVDYFRLPKRQYYWYQECYAKGNKKPVAPVWPTNGTPAQLKLETDKNEIAAPDGTDDVMLTVTVQDAKGKAISNNVPVTLKIVSGPGEFPTGTTLQFLPPSNDEKADIFIRDGKCAIDFRSYYAGTTVIEASSPGLKSSTITLTTLGSPSWIEGVTPAVADRPYLRYKEDRPPLTVSEMLLAKDRPCSASTTASGLNKSFANDENEATLWKPTSTDTEKWWKLDMEATYSLNRIQLIFGNKAAHQYIIEVSADDKEWKKVIDQSDNAASVQSQMNYGNLGREVRFVRVRFNSANPSISEIRVGGASNLVEKPDLLTGTIIGINGSWDNAANATKEAAFDFDSETFFDAPSGASGFWVGLDLGKDANYQPTKVIYRPRIGLGGRMRNGSFDIATSSSFANATSLYKITNDAPEKNTTVDFTTTAATRYIRYNSTPNGNGNVAELEFYGTPIATGIHTVSSADNVYTKISNESNQVTVLSVSNAAPSPRSLEIMKTDGAILQSFSFNNDRIVLSEILKTQGIYLIKVTMGNVTELHKVRL